MENRFTANCIKKETMSANYQRQARVLRETNNNKPSEQECRFLQMAADLEFELSQISIGAEQTRHEREKNRLDYEIAKIRRELNKSFSDTTTANKDGNTSSNGNNNNTAQKTKDEEALERTVRTWYKEIPKHSFDDVSGMVELKKRLQECITDAKAEKLMDYLKIPHLNSYFFVGPPGCGKTYIIEAFAHELMDKNYKYLSLQGSDIISRYVGDAEKIVTRLFEEVRQNAPCILFIDEIDSVCKNRSLPNLPEYAANITTSFLTGFNSIHSSDSKVIFIGATNYPQRVDSAMLDRVEVIEVPLPDYEARKAAFIKHFDKIISFDDKLTYDTMAGSSKEFNYRDIDRICIKIKKQLFKDSMSSMQNQDDVIYALQNAGYILTLEDWKNAMEDFKPSPKNDILSAIETWKKRNLENFYEEETEEVRNSELFDNFMKAFLNMAKSKKNADTEDDEPKQIQE